MTAQAKLFPRLGCESPPGIVAGRALESRSHLRPGAGRSVHSSDASPGDTDSRRRAWPPQDFATFPATTASSSPSPAPALSSRAWPSGLSRGRHRGADERVRSSGPWRSCASLPCRGREVSRGGVTVGVPLGRSWWARWQSEQETSLWAWTEVRHCATCGGSHFLFVTSQADLRSLGRFESPDVEDLAHLLTSAGDCSLAGPWHSSHFSSTMNILLLKHLNVRLVTGHAEFVFVDVLRIRDLRQRDFQRGEVVAPRVGGSLSSRAGAVPRSDPGPGSPCPSRVGFDSAPLFRWVGARNESKAQDADHDQLRQSNQARNSSHEIHARSHFLSSSRLRNGGLSLHRKPRWTLDRSVLPTSARSSLAPTSSIVSVSESIPSEPTKGPRQEHPDSTQWRQSFTAATATSRTIERSWQSGKKWLEERVILDERLVTRPDLDEKTNFPRKRVENGLIDAGQIAARIQSVSADRLSFVEFALHFLPHA